MFDLAFICHITFTIMSKAEDEDRYFMSLALEQAKKALDAKEVSVGALAVTLSVNMQ